MCVSTSKEEATATLKQCTRNVNVVVHKGTEQCLQAMSNHDYTAQGNLKAQQGNLWLNDFEFGQLGDEPDVPNLNQRGQYKIEILKVVPCSRCCLGFSFE